MKKIADVAMWLGSLMGKWWILFLTVLIGAIIFKVFLYLTIVMSSYILVMTLAEPDERAAFISKFEKLKLHLKHWWSERP